MRSSRPPSAATWLLKHLTPKHKTDALVGDLLEDFADRRSAGWYWRQVLSTILVGFVQKPRLAAKQFLSTFIGLIGCSTCCLAEFFMRERISTLACVNWFLIGLFGLSIGLFYDWFKRRYTGKRRQILRLILLALMAVTLIGRFFHVSPLWVDCIFFIGIVLGDIVFLLPSKHLHEDSNSTLNPD